MISVRVVGIAAVLAVLALAASPAVVDAQAAPTIPTIDTSPKGTIGLGLIGAEIGLALPAMLGLDQWWALTITTVGGAAGGALAGYFAIDKPAREKAAVSVLVVGIALVVPTVILTVKGLRYDPDDEKAPEIDPYAKRRRRNAELARAGSGLLRRSKYGFHVGLPGVSAQETAYDPERSGYLPTTGSELHFSVASGAF